MKQCLWSILLSGMFVLPATAQTNPLTGTWKLRAMGFDFDADGKSDRDLWRDCREGSTFTFNADGSGSQYKGTKPCGNPAQNPASFTWHAIDPLNFSMEQGSSSELVHVVSQSATELHLYWTKTKLLIRLER